MRNPIRAIGIVSLALATAVVLFPPRKVWLPDGGRFTSFDGLRRGYPEPGTRVFLFSGDLYHGPVTSSGVGMEVNTDSTTMSGRVALAAEVDAGRLFAELALVGIACGVGMLLASGRAPPRTGPT